ncbi:MULTISPECIES: hypothetical protein [Pseudomonas]|uniref:hypothetical protein n=1 Tax=Pseudomonas TaxID=286 RepID=UPI0011B7254F|nr:MULTISPECIES: hypothetical protein [Pseudomonas]MBS7562501.1 hypothetical protein [Pseudomonas sp. RC4D1]MCO7577577.1 hypothetical protein [Pseudomonas protegens]MCO7583707.1 hypothetical protein [Pseudomonas chlororaphis]MCO7600960.1 hypothetical protein [Pseudomonas chlororaphis]
MKFKLSFTRTNKSDSMEIDIFTLEVDAHVEPKRIADFDQGTASVCFGYPGSAEEYSIVSPPTQDDLVVLELAGKPIFRLWQRDSDDLSIGAPVTVSQGEFDQSQGRVTRRSW